MEKTDGAFQLAGTSTNSIWEESLSDFGTTPSGIIFEPIILPYDSNYLPRCLCLSEQGV